MGDPVYVMGDPVSRKTWFLVDRVPHSGNKVTLFFNLKGTVFLRDCYYAYKERDLVSGENSSLQAPFSKNEGSSFGKPGLPFV